MNIVLKLNGHANYYTLVIVIIQSANAAWKHASYLDKFIAMRAVSLNTNANVLLRRYILYCLIAIKAICGNIIENQI